MLQRKASTEYACNAILQTQTAQVNRVHGVMGIYRSFDSNYNNSRSHSQRLCHHAASQHQATGSMTTTLSRDALFTGGGCLLTQSQAARSTMEETESETVGYVALRPSVIWWER
jgi:hypothetical protein